MTVKEIMERAVGITLLLSCLFFLAESEVMDITTWGAKSYGPDIAPILLKAWDKACWATTPSKIWIPKGTYYMEEIILKGPCKSPGIEIQNDGVITGPEEPSAITKDNEWIMVEHVEHLTISGCGTYDGKGAAKSWLQSDRCSSASSCNKRANNFAFYYTNHSTVTGITSKDSKLFHFMLMGCEDFTIKNIKIDAWGMSPNTDGIHIGKSTGVNILDSVIQTGDDCISMGDGSKKIFVSGITCGPGHGISIGSLGKYPKEWPVEGVWVKNCKFINTDNGVRIKTWAGPNCPPSYATDIHFENIDMQNVTFPIVIDQIYCPSAKCNLEPPSKVQVSKVSFRGIKGTSGMPEVAKLICSRNYPCKDVEIGDVSLTYNGPLGAARTNCSNIQPTFTGKQTPKFC